MQLATEMLPLKGRRRVAPLRLSICVLLTHLFADRYLGNNDTDRREILHEIGPGRVLSPFGGGTPKGSPKSKI